MGWNIIPSSPVPFEVLSSLSWRWTNAADTGFKENKDWLELFKHASVLSWFQLRGGILESNFSTTFVKYVQKPFAIVRASVVVFFIYCDRLNRSWLLRCDRFVGKDFLNCFPEILGIIKIFFYDSVVVAGFRFSIKSAVTWFLKLLYLDQCNSVFVLWAWR